MRRTPRARPPIAIEANPVWAETGLDFWAGKLCVWCLETRLGRKLNPGDLKDCPIWLIRDRATTAPAVGDRAS